ncbi:MAG: anthranilate synthase component I family protein [Leptospiraceae bacterium]|nr:anthranilate synthase component I family protein [Leptospiraceae bacterium]MCP5510979.1 anthranilate synthase component I family protein [Leptospiraceae bacterium]
MDLPVIQLNRKPRYLKIQEKINFLSLFQVIEKDNENCFFLESLDQDNYNSRYSIIGFQPEGLITSRGDELHWNGKTYHFSNPYWELRKLMPPPNLSRDYAGGLVGYLSYEAMNYFEPTLNLPVDERFPQIQMGIYKDGLVEDKMTGEIFYFYYDHSRLDMIQEYIHSEKIEAGKVSIEKLGFSMSEDEHSRNVESILEEIRSGNTFQCQLGFKTEYKITGDLFSVYLKLREINPSPHMYFIKFGEIKILGASPELLFRLHNGQMESFPLAGSIRRGRNPEEDREFTRKLLNDPKEIAEHNMLVDLHRNDIGRVSQYGTVKVRKFMDIKKFSHIQHISSEVTGIIKHSEDMFSGLAANFPAGTLSGAPKIESMKIIRKTEKIPRGIYGGAIGHFGFNGNCTFAIPIRSLFVSGTYAYTQASGGIVYDSLPENEYDEIKRKSRALEKVLESL